MMGYLEGGIGSNIEWTDIIGQPGERCGWLDHVTVASVGIHGFHERHQFGPQPGQL